MQVFTSPKWQYKDSLLTYYSLDALQVHMCVLFSGVGPKVYKSAGGTTAAAIPHTGGLCNEGWRVKVLFFRPGSPGTRCRVKKLVILFWQAPYFFPFEIIVTMRRHENLKRDFGTSNCFTCPDDKEQKEPSTFRKSCNMIS